MQPGGFTPKECLSLHGQLPACWPRALAAYPAVHIAAAGGTLLQGVDLDQLLDMSTDELVEMFAARQRRRCACSIGFGL